jgi:hypothetical protein
MHAFVIMCRPVKVVPKDRSARRLGPACIGPDRAQHRRQRPRRPRLVRSRLVDACGIAQVDLQHHTLTASAALVWSGDLPRPLQQMLFDTADSLTEPVHPQPADLISLTTA